MNNLQLRQQLNEIKESLSKSDNRSPAPPTEIEFSPKFEQDLERLSKLQDGWRDPDSKAPSTDIIQFVIGLIYNLKNEKKIEEPELFPTEEGGIHMHWNFKGSRLYCTLEENFDFRVARDEGLNVKIEDYPTGEIEAADRSARIHDIVIGEIAKISLRT